MVDIYENLDNFDEVNLVNELKVENKELKCKLDRYEMTIDKLRKDFEKLTDEHHRLLSNYSSLLMTAKAEIQRKTETISMVNKEKDQMFLRLINKKNKRLLNNGARDARGQSNKMDLENTLDLKQPEKLPKENRMFRAPQFSSDEDDVALRSTRDSQESKGYHTQNTNRDLWDVMHRNRQRTKYRERDQERDRWSGEHYNYQEKQRLSPERYQRGRAPIRDYPETHRRDRSRKRILKSPVHNYERSKSRDRRYLRDHSDERQDVHHSLKHKIEDSNYDSCPKRKRTESSQESHKRPQPQLLENKYLEGLASCQSPEDYFLVDEIHDETHCPKEIKATAASKLDDPRENNSRYILVTDDKKLTSLSTVVGRNVDIKQIPWYSYDTDKECNKSDHNDKIENSEDVDIVLQCEASNMSVESGEIIDNVQNMGSHHINTDLVCRHRKDKTQTSITTDTASSSTDLTNFTIPKRCKSNNIDKDTPMVKKSTEASPVELLFRQYESSQTSKKDKISCIRLTSEKSEEGGKETDIKNQSTSSKVKNKSHHSYKKSIVEGDLELSDDTGEYNMEQVVKDSKYPCKTKSKNTLKLSKYDKEDAQQNEPKNEDKHDVLKSNDVSKENYIKHKSEDIIKTLTDIKEDNVQKIGDKCDVFKSNDSYKENKIDQKNRDSCKEKDVREKKSKEVLTNKAISNKKSKSENKTKHDSKNDDTILATKFLTVQERKNEYEVKNVSQTSISQTNKSESVKKSKDRHKEKDEHKTESPKQTKPNKECRNENKNIDSNDKEIIKMTINYNADKESKNEQKVKDTYKIKNDNEGKDIIVCKDDQGAIKIRKNESAHKHKHKKISAKEKLSEEKIEAKIASSNKSTSVHKNNNDKDINKSENIQIKINKDIINDTATNIVNEANTNNETTGKSKQQGICEKNHDSKLKKQICEKAKNIEEKMSELFGDSSLITPEDLNIGSQNPGHIYGDVPVYCLSEAQNADDDIWNMVTVAEPGDNVTKQNKICAVSSTNDLITTDKRFSITTSNDNINNLPTLEEVNDLKTNVQKPNDAGSNKPIRKQSNNKSLKYKHETLSSNKEVILDTGNNEGGSVSSNNKTIPGASKTCTDISLVHLNDNEKIENPVVSLELTESIKLTSDVVSTSEQDVVKTVIISTGVQPQNLQEIKDDYSKLNTQSINKDMITPIKALATSTPAKETTNSNLSHQTSAEDVSVDTKETLNDKDDKPDIRICIVRKGRRSLRRPKS